MQFFPRAELDVPFELIAEPASKLQEEPADDENDGLSEVNFFKGQSQVKGKRQEQNMLTPMTAERISMWVSCRFHQLAVAKTKTVRMQKISPMTAGTGCAHERTVVNGRPVLPGSQ